MPESNGEVWNKRIPSEIPGNAEIPHHVIEAVAVLNNIRHSDNASHRFMPDATNAAIDRALEAVGMPDVYYHKSDGIPKRESIDRSWLVESRIDGKFDGWFAAPAFGVGGWNTSDPNEAKRYTQSEAEAVAHALTYFHAPFNYSNWIATEHMWVES